MKLILKKGQLLEEILPLNKHSKITKKRNAQKYVGVLNLKEDPLEIQRRMRNDWEQDIN
ncbi:hypothetical protein [Dyadobacter arcticus]|uniref:DUF2281 domain-containing protein n=1 Tax=Dyadobacter arcticus TaxID=1078754 RepID=A0ABX0UCX3_9BACT|nr:hypothetical protein [Dyadobacter arcticus]NIJ50868.1 hypothetical protein [Dyadobacter arcticus]